ncbi:uncharacterized protein LOC114128338 [Aphis gossypii]|uniref:uncharacterized protein LOC114128338 n=1 Tax=Aphis gossypii TaxID=80765 RepID=UPI002158D61E|nr:uncharacterized protein LOC114128338 [Aphis gossypii]
MDQFEEPWFTCFISKVEDDPRDEITNNMDVSQIKDKTKRLFKLYMKKKKEYWSSLATKRRIQTSTITNPKPIVSMTKNNKAQKKSWSADRLNELSKPRFDYYEYTEEVTTWRRYRQVNIQRIYDLATPRRVASSVDQAPRKCNCCKVPLSVLLPRIEKLSIPPKRTNVVEQIKSDEDTFSVKKSALKYVASERLKRLATPRPMYHED